MRFSLTTLLLLSLLSGSLMAVWFRREAWYQVREYTSTKEWEEKEGQWRAPDGLRMLAPGGREGDSLYQVIRKKDNIQPLFKFKGYYFAKPYAARFENNDEVHISSEQYGPDIGELRTIYVFRRRHPEWWWGTSTAPKSGSARRFSLPS